MLEPIFSAATLRRAVKRNMHWLVQNIEPMDHLDYLFSYDAINREEYEKIRTQLTQSEKVLGPLAVYNA